MAASPDSARKRTRASAATATSPAGRGRLDGRGAAREALGAAGGGVGGEGTLGVGLDQERRDALGAAAGVDGDEGQEGPDAGPGAAGGGLPFLALALCSQQRRLRTGGHAVAPGRMSADESLVWERLQPTKHEYFHGDVFAVAGRSARHDFLSNAVGAELRATMRGKGCHALSSDQRIAARQGQRHVYADAVVGCGGVQTEQGTSDVLANPSVIVEVLSPGTETYDRGEKWEG
jgi:hypothetical protein